MLPRASGPEAQPPTLRELGAYFFRLGSLGFGGPIALAGYMQRDLVERRGWISQEEYLEGLAAAQTLPGPLAAQLAMWLGHVRRGFWGASVAGLAFILPPFVIVSLAAWAYVAFSGSGVVGALFYGVAPAVIALILRGAWKLLRVTVKSDRRLWLIFAAVGAITFVARSEVAILFVAAGLVGIALYAPPGWLRAHGTSVGAWFPMVGNGLVTATAAAAADPATLLALALFFFKAGAFTFGSGLAIVPFLQEGVVHEHGWLTERAFLDSVAMGMITPGPVVISAVFVGFLVAGLPGATVAGIGVFLPPFLMVVLFAPWIRRYRRHPVVQGFTKGATAAAAGAIVGAGAVIATQVLIDVPTLLIFAVCFVFLWRFKVNEPLLVAGTALAGLSWQVLQ